MTRILIPTRNRPSSLISVLRYLDEFFPQAEVIVADGSADQHAETNARNTGSRDFRIGIDYRRFPYELPLFDRLLDVLSGEPDEFFIMGSDDDYPVLGVLDQLKSKLEADPGAVTAMGPTLNLFFRPDEKAVARLGLARTIRGASFKARASAYASWPFSTTYAVSRRELLIERYRRARTLLISGFFDFGVGLQDCAHGSIIAGDRFSFISTRNYRHSYLRKSRRMMFLEQSSDIEQLMAYIADDLVKFDGIAREDATEIAEELTRYRIAEHLGFGPDKMRGFEYTRTFLSPPVQRQIIRFEEAFSGPCDARAELDPYLSWINTSIKAIVQSTDNIGEAHNVASLNEQMSADTAEDEEPKEFFDLAPRRGRRRMGIVSPASWLWDDMPEGNTLHVLAMGQSNIANHGLSPSKSTFGSVNVDGASVPLEDPIPGGSGTGGSIWPRVGEKIAIQRMFSAFQLSLVAKGGTSIAEWLEDAHSADGLKLTLARLANATPKVNCIVWHQGEKDNLLHTPPDEYFSSFSKFHNIVSQFLPGVTWIICRASFRMGKINHKIVAAQNRIVAEIPNCIAGPNTDVLGREYRVDDTHWNNEGLSVFADLLVERLSRARL
jgi:glycosyltransferase domain-containing protein